MVRYWSMLHRHQILGIIQESYPELHEIIGLNVAKYVKREDAAHLGLIYFSPEDGAVVFSVSTNCAFYLGFQIYGRVEGKSDIVEARMMLHDDFSQKLSDIVDLKTVEEKLATWIFESPEFVRQPTGVSPQDVETAATIYQKLVNLEMAGDGLDYQPLPSGEKPRYS